MKFYTAVAVLAGIIDLTSAAPTPETDSNPSKPSSYKHFYLQSKIISNSGPADLDGLYVYPYHTGAGLADAALSKKPYYTSFINGTYLEFDLSEQEAGGEYFPAGMDLVLQTEYTAFQPVQINGGYGSRGFHIEDGKLLSHYQKEFGGWRICRWWHYNTPQLFHKYNFAEDPKISSNCADVDLAVVPAKP